MIPLNLASASICLRLRARSLALLFFFSPPAAQLSLPAFRDVVGEVVPVVPPWRVRGTVVQGLGRGSKSLGIPTANLPPGAWDRFKQPAPMVFPPFLLSFLD